MANASTSFSWFSLRGIIGFPVTLNTMTLPDFSACGAIAFDDVYNDLFFQRVVFGTVFLQLGNVLLECTHFLLITPILLMTLPRATMRSLGYKAFYQLHVGVVYAIKYYRVNIFKNNQFFYIDMF